MCLAPEVDLVAGAAIAAVAVDSLRHVRHRRTLPLAALPAVFAVHTFAEAFGWWGGVGAARSRSSSVTQPRWSACSSLTSCSPSTYPSPFSCSSRTVVGATACCCSAAPMRSPRSKYAAALIAGNGTAEACDLAFAYRVSGTAAAAGALYIGATCGEMLLSGQRPLTWWSLANAVAVLAVWSREVPHSL